MDDFLGDIDERTFDFSPHLRTPLCILSLRERLQLLLVKETVFICALDPNPFGNPRVLTPAALLILAAGLNLSLSMLPSSYPPILSAF